MPDRPLVRVGPYGVLGDYEQVTCSRCGLLGSGPSSSIARNRLGNLAWNHARHVHDGDVDREGWT
jgi:hypothetical protein